MDEEVTRLDCEQMPAYLDNLSDKSDGLRQQEVTNVRASIILEQRSSERSHLALVVTNAGGGRQVSVVSGSRGTNDASAARTGHH